MFPKVACSCRAALSAASSSVCRLGVLFAYSGSCLPVLTRVFCCRSSLCKLRLSIDTLAGLAVAMLLAVLPTPLSSDSPSAHWQGSPCCCCCIVLVGVSPAKLRRPGKRCKLRLSCAFDHHLMEWCSKSLTLAEDAGCPSRAL